MALRKYVGQKLSKLTKETIEEEIEDLYKYWATEFDKDRVITSVFLVT